MSDLAGELFARVLGALAAEVREGARRVVQSGAPGAGDDPEAVHDFRVALRRLRTLLRFARPIHGERRMRSIGDALGRIADATGALRDAEVLRETLGGLHVAGATRAAADAFVEARARDERGARASVVELLRGGPGGREAGPLEPALAALDARLARGPSRKHAANPPTARGVALASMREALDDVDAHADHDVGDVEGMHALRIRFKRLRYASELFGPLLGEPAAAASKAATKMQKRLGDLHDLDEAITVVGAARTIHRAPRRELVAALRLSRAKASVRVLEDLGATREVLARVSRVIGPEREGGGSPTVGAVGSSPPPDAA